MWNLLRTIFLLILPAFTLGQGNETALRAALQTGYDKYTRPAIPTNISLFHSIRSLQNLDISAETMRHAAFVRLDWLDSRLTWDPAQYNNISVLTVNWCWRPEFLVGNSADEIPLIGYDDDETRIRIFSTGEVSWGVYFTVETDCEINTANFPYDEQTCDVELGFLYHDYDVNLLITLTMDKVSTDFFLSNGEWDLVDSKNKLQVWSVCCPNMKPSEVVVSLTFRRRQPYYLINIIMPIVLLSFCVPWAFFLTTESGERLGYALTMLLSYFVFMSFIAGMIPSTSLNVPVLAQYLLTVLILCILALVTVAIDVKLYFKESDPPRYAKVFFKYLKIIVTASCCSTRHKSPVRPITVSDVEGHEKRNLPDVEVSSSSTSAMSSEFETDDIVKWRCISIVLDRFLFYLYNVAVFFCNMGLFIALYS